uniref:C3H1-type domain-containing protein n=1 Tax=Steinernema glaseri TaxID=37863 RepID=A0A1I7ZHL4_9BILA
MRMCSRSSNCWTSFQRMRWILAMDTAGSSTCVPRAGSDNNMFQGLNPKDRRNLLIHFNKLLENRRPMTQEEINDGSRVFPSPALKPRNPELYKTTLCQYWQATKEICRYGSQCWYAHGPDELRQKIVDPFSTSGNKPQSPAPSGHRARKQPNPFGVREIDAFIESQTPVFTRDPSYMLHPDRLRMVVDHDSSPPMPFQEVPGRCTLAPIGSERRKFRSSVYSP